MDLFDIINVVWTGHKKGFRPAMRVAAEAMVGIGAGIAVGKLTQKAVRLLTTKTDKDE